MLVNGAAVRFTMGAFALRIDGTAVLIGCGVGLALGVVGAVPPAIRAADAAGGWVESYVMLGKID